MDSQGQQKAQIVSVCNPYLSRLKCFLCHALNPNINDENNNFQKDNNTNEKPFNPISKLPLYTCPECEAKIRLEEKETASSSTVTSQKVDEEEEEESDRMIIVQDTSSDDECWCESCAHDENDTNYRQLWDDLSHIIKCVYRATDKQFSDEICKAKEYVKKLTEIHPQSLFTKLESIVLEYVREIRNQVLDRFHTCSKTSHDVQLFISFLLDEYHIFIQAANNVSPIVSYLEEHYMKSFNLTWLLYNKHLYEKLIYMDRKIQHSMSTMIDLLQPSNDDGSDYSPAEYTQLLNRFLAFDEEMSEIACLYKDSQAKRATSSMEISIQNGYQSEKKNNQMKKKKKKKCKKSKTSQTSTQDNSTSSTITAVDIPATNTSSSVPVPSQQGSNASSIGSGIGGDESSSVSSIDDYLLDNDTSSSGYTQEEQDELAHIITEEDLNELLLESILDGISPMTREQRQRYRLSLNEDQTNPTTTIVDNGKWFEEIIQGIHLAQEKEQKTTATDDTATSKKEEEEEAVSNISTKPDSSSSSSSKKSSTNKSKSSKSSHRRKETISSSHPTGTTATTSQIPKKSIAPDLILPRSIADLSAKIQSVSFTAGTFGSITSTNSNESYHSSSSSANSSTTTLTAAKTTTSTGQTRLSINLTRKPGSKTTEHGGQKIAEALFNELTGFGSEDCLNSGRKKDNHQQFKKNKQQRSGINETSLNSTSNSHPLFNPSNKSDCESSSSAYNNLDHLLRHAASNSDVSEAALHSILSSFHSPTSADSSTTKQSISSKTSEALQSLLAQQHHYQHQKKTLASHSKHCEFCCCEFSEGRTCSASPCLHLSSAASASNGPITSCVTCMSLPGGSATSATTTSVMNATIAGVFNQRDVDVKERLKLKLTKRNLTEQQTLFKEQPQKPKILPNKKQPVQNNAKMKDTFLNDKNDIDDLVRFIDGDESTSTSNTTTHEQQISAVTTTTTNEVTSKKNKRKKEKQNKAHVNNQEENKSNSSPLIQTTQKKPNGAITIQQQTPRSASSSSTASSQVTSIPASNPLVEFQQPLSKRKQKAKLKLELQQKQAENNAEEPSNTSDIASVTVPPVSTSAAIVKKTSTAAATSSSSHKTNSPRTAVNLSSENFDAPEEEVNWITISRKQSKQKPTPSSVPSLLAAPVLPVVPPTTTKQHRQQQQTTTNGKKTNPTTNSSPLAQQKVIPSTSVTGNINPETTCTTNKQPHTAGASVRSSNVGKNHASHQIQKLESSVPSQPPVNLWTNNNIREQPPVIPPSSFHPSTPSFIPNHTPSSPPPSFSSLITPSGIGGASPIPPSSSSSILSEGLPSSMYWDPNSYIRPTSLPSQSTTVSSTVPGPVQRPSTSFSPAPGAMNNTTSRCIQRPSPEPRSCSTVNSVPFPLYSPMNYAVGSSTGSWNDTSVTNTHDSQWNYPQEQQQLGSSTTPTDFPLYDPFHSGAGLSIPSTTQSNLLTNGFSEHFADLGTIPQGSDFNEMDAFDKEIEDFKKFCFESVPLETREKVQANVDRCFVRQA